MTMKPEIVVALIAACGVLLSTAVSFIVSFWGKKIQLSSFVCRNRVAKP